MTSTNNETFASTSSSASGGYARAERVHIPLENESKPRPLAMKQKFSDIAFTSNPNNDRKNVKISLDIEALKGK